MNKEIYFEERWTPITNKSVPNIIEGMYFISDRGRVISKSSHRKNIKILALVQTVNGYYRVNLQTRYGSIEKQVHRLVLQCHGDLQYPIIPIYDISNKLDVNHNVFPTKWNYNKSIT